MKRKILVLIMVSILIVFSTAIAFAEFYPDDGNKIQLNQGENEVLMPLNFSPVYVSDLMKAYPEIEMVTYIESYSGIQEEIKEIGYVNVFGGVGKNFIIYGNSTYYIYVKENLEVSLK